MSQLGHQLFLLVSGKRVSTEGRCCYRAEAKSLYHSGEMTKTQ